MQCTYAQQSVNPHSFPLKSFAYVWSGCKKTSLVTTSCYHVAAQRVVSNGAAVSTKPNRGQSDLTTSRAPSVKWIVQLWGRLEDTVPMSFRAAKETLEQAWEAETASGTIFAKGRGGEGYIQSVTWCKRFYPFRNYHTNLLIYHTPFLEQPYFSYDPLNIL